MTLLTAYSLGYSLGQKVKFGRIPYVSPARLTLPPGIYTRTPQARAYVEGYKKGVVT